MKKSNKLVITLVFISTLISCSSDDDNTTVVPVANIVRLASITTHGSILTDSEGMSLYFFSKDTKQTSACLDECLDVWPVFYDANITVDSGLDVNDFATITRADGIKQTTYLGWPLYYFVNDVAEGDTNGDDVNNVWFIAKPDYSLMYVVSQLVGHDGLNYTSEYTEGNGDTFYMTDIEGNTLYTFINDTNGVNNFTAPDFSNNGVWPIAEISLDKIPSILNNSDFSTIDIFGRTQLTYKGWPLYYFGQDTNRGDNKGISFPAPGVWSIANVDTEVAQ